MEQGNKKIIIIAVIMAVLTSVLVFAYFKQLEKKNNDIEYVNVIVAVSDIDAKVSINSSLIKEIKIEKQLVNKDAVINKADVIGKTVKDKIFEGEQILKSRLSNKDNSTLSYEIPKGKRAITVNVNEASAVGFFVNPGDYIDLLATFQKESQDSPIPAKTKTLLQNVLVLGVAQQKDVVEKVTGTTTQKDLKSAGNTENNTIKTVTLAVTPEQAEKVTLSEETGILKMILRPAGETNNITIPGITKDQLIQ